MSTLSEQIKSNWAIVLFIGGLIVSWTMFSSGLAQAQRDIEDLKESKTTSDLRFQNLEANVFLLCKAQNLNCIPPIK